MNPSPITTSIRFRLLLTLVTAAVVTGAWFALRRPSANETARKVKPIPRSVADDQGFAGSEACVRCHDAEAAKFAGSGHAHTFHEAKSFDLSRSLAGKTFQDEERQAEFRYELDNDGLTVALPEKFNDEHFPLTYALGSGRHAVTFLTLIPNRAGETVGIEHRVSLFREGTQLGLTPSHRGLVATQSVEHFGKVVKGDKLKSCVGCHTTVAEFHDHTPIHLLPHVGCESCHGPGAKHIAAAENLQSDLAIGFSPSHHGAFEQIRMCGRCHRLPEMLSAPPSKKDAKLARFQPVGLLQSRCFQESNDTLSCTTCHDPHQTVSHNTADHVRHCLNCHSPQSKTQKSCKVSPTERCVECHMPAVEVHPNVSFHDHWIRVRDANDSTSVSNTGRSDDHSEP